MSCKWKYEALLNIKNIKFFLIARVVQARCQRAKPHRVDFIITEVKPKRAGYFHIPELLIRGLVSMETLSAV